MRVLLFIGSLAAAASTQPRLLSRFSGADHTHCISHGVATASCFGFNSSDSTVSLQIALSDPRVQLLRIDHPGKPWVVQPLFIRRNHLRVEFAPGVEVVAKKNEFHWTNDCLLTIDNATNVSLSGYGAVLRMHRADCKPSSWPYTYPPHKIPKSTYRTE